MSACTPECTPLKPGGKPEHCKARGCHQTFSGTSLGDSHRYGPHEDRHCHDTAWMVEQGWRLINGVWRGKAMDAEVLERRIGAA